MHEVTAKAITDLSETLQLGGVLQEFAEDLDNLEYLWEPPMKARQCSPGPVQPWPSAALAQCIAACLNAER